MDQEKAEHKAREIAAKVLQTNVGTFTVARYLGMSTPYTQGHGSRVPHPKVMAVKDALDKLIVELNQGSEGQ
ncbi:hypothetical protein AB0G15_05895 [Streptosporangium sp. NPDC023825]|uniref:hypothetical protein n=1 Tax=Streptosporangium sp. NPDC023825 TaxID=3154909 RepID=UPI00343EA8D8